MKKCAVSLSCDFFPDGKMLDCAGTRFQEFLKGFVTAAYAARLPAMVNQCSSYCLD